MAKSQGKAVSSFRKRLKRQGMARLEVNVRKEDAPLIRNVVRALVSPQHERAARAFLHEHFSAGEAKGLKAILAAAPLEGVDLNRGRDFGPDVYL
jgi:hypothetical protein